MVANENIGKHKNLQDKREKEKIYFTWGLPIACGVFSFLYWFVFIPVLWYLFNLHSLSTPWTWLLGAFLLWAGLVLPCLCWWNKKRKNIVRPSIATHQSPCFPTEITPVQPDGTPLPRKACSVLLDRKSYSSKESISLSMHSIPIQSQTTPSLYNLRTGRQSFDIDHYNTDKNIEHSPVPLTAASKMDTRISVNAVKSTAVKEVSDRRMEVSISSNNISTHSEGDRMEQFTETSNKSGEKNIAFQRNKEVPHELSREKSFRGLPDFKSFNDYLKLVTIDTPLSPREVFFSDLIQSGENKNSVERRSFSVSDVPPQRSVAEARKSMPWYLYSSPIQDIETGKVVIDQNQEKEYFMKQKQDHDDRKTAFHVVNERDSFRNSLQNDSDFIENDKSKRKSMRIASASGSEYFVAEVVRTESVTSEVYISINGEEHPQAYRIGRLESTNEVKKSNSSEEGRYIILSSAKHSSLEFIRNEQQALSNELQEAQADNDSDSVFEDNKLESVKGKNSD